MNVPYSPRPQPQFEGPLTDKAIRAMFEKADDFTTRDVQLGKTAVTAYFIDGLTSGGDISEYVVRPLTDNLPDAGEQELYDAAFHGRVYCATASEVENLESACTKLVNGFCVVLFPGIQKALAFETKTGEKRSPSAPEVEKTAKGPKDAFTETIRTNTSLLRRHLRTPKLRLEPTVVGRKSLTNCAVVWVEDLTDETMVQRVKDRLDSIDIDGFLSPAAVEEYLSGSRASAFPMLQSTERTDKFSQGLLNGQVGVVVDGLPLGYLLPVDLATMMRSPEDRTMDYISASFLKILRYLSLLVSLFLPALYIAMAEFHQEMLPTSLLLSIIESKQSVPFPTIVEVLGLLVAFELLQAAGLQLPQSVGQTVSIIGGLVVGSAAVEAKLISPAALIVVAVAGICGYTLSGQDFSGAVRIWRFGLSVCAAVAGLFGIVAGFLALLIHLAGLESMGRSYLAPFSRLRGGDQLLRRRLVTDKFRDPALHPRDERKQR